MATIESPMTLDRLVELESERVAAEEAAIAATTARNEAVLALLDGNVRQAEIARRLGLSPGRVSQIVAAGHLRRAVA